MSEHDPSGQSVSIHEISAEKPPSQQIIERVGEESDTPLVPDAETDPEQTLPPLYSVIDSDALDAFVESSAESQSPNARIEFSYHGYTVTICTDRPTPIIQLNPENQTAKPCPLASASD